VKALLATGLVSRDPDPRGQAGFWLTGSVPEPHTWYRGIRALPAGGLAWVDERGSIATKRWCDIGDHWRQAPDTDVTDDDVLATVHAALRRSVEAHLVSDVPVGVFLSGGIDSGAIAGLMRESDSTALKAVTIGFREFAGKHQDEAPFAARLAAECGIEHHVRIVTREEFEQDVARILDAMDQPSVDGVNTWFASKAVAELGLKVVVSGLGGDELFQGYRHFRYLPHLVAAWSRGARFPGAVAATDFLSRIQARRSGNARWRHFSSLARSLPGAWFLRRGLFAPEELGDIMGDEMAAEALRGFDAEQWVTEQCGPLPREPHLALSLIESTLYLRNQLLRDSDWASMAHSVELRTPLVDVALLRDVMQVGRTLRRFPRKALLSSAARALSAAVTERRKSGFDTPINTWLSQATQGTSHPTRSWARFLTGSHARFV
jgi:asparagine synthase (glutamine-hydrolysing)